MVKRSEIKLIDKAIKAFYEGDITAEEFVEYHWHDSWGALLTHVEEKGYGLINGKIPKSLNNPDKKKEFEAALEAYNASKQRKSQPQGQSTSNPSWNRLTQGTYIRSNVRGFYKGTIPTKRFIECYGGTWDELLQQIVKDKKFNSKEDIPNEFLSRQKEFENALIEYMENEYCKMTSIVVDQQRKKPTAEDVNKAIEYLQQRGESLGKLRIGEVIRLYLRGEIQIPNEDEKLEQDSNELDKMKKRAEELKAMLEQGDSTLTELEKIAGELKYITGEIDEITMRIEGKLSNKPKGELENNTPEI